MEGFKELKEKTLELSRRISSAEQGEDSFLAIKLKKELYQTKLLMIELIEREENRAGITARELIEKVRHMKHVPQYAIGIKPIDVELNDWKGRSKNESGGIESGTFINLAGESGAGKTTLTLDILSNVAEYSKCVFFNHEMGERRISSRLQKRLTREAQLDNLVIDSYTANLNEMAMEIALYAKDGIKFFVIDSRMKIQADGDSDVQKNANISARLAKLCQEKDIIIILINQMSESDIKDGRLALKGSGDQKYDSDMLWFYVVDKKNPTMRKLICTKNRTGEERLWSVDLTLDANGKTIGANDGIPSCVVEYKTPISNVEEITYSMPIL